MQRSGRRDGIRTKSSTPAACATTRSAAIWADYLPRALADGTYLPAPEPHIVGSGLDHSQGALDTHRRGVPAEKIGVTITH